MFGDSNLPEGTELSISVTEEAPSGFIGQSKTAISKDGTYQSEGFGPNSGLPLGRYVLSVTLPIPRVQPANVCAVIGANGENLVGPLVERGKFSATIDVKNTLDVGGEAALIEQRSRALRIFAADRAFLDGR